MVKYALKCQYDHGFEAWFSNSAAYEEQLKKSQIECPQCGSSDISKQIMAPSIRDSGAKRQAAPTEKTMAEFAGKIRSHISDNFAYVGDKFADEARAMHKGEKKSAAIWGKTTPEQATALSSEGVSALPLPEPFAPPAPVTDTKKLN